MNTPVFRIEPNSRACAVALRKEEWRLYSRGLLFHKPQPIPDINYPDGSGYNQVQDDEEVWELLEYYMWRNS